MGRRGERCNCGKKMTDWEIKGVDMLYVGRFVSATKKAHETEIRKKYIYVF